MAIIASRRFGRFGFAIVLLAVVGLFAFAAASVFYILDLRQKKDELQATLTVAVEQLREQQVTLDDAEKKRELLVSENARMSSGLSNAEASIAQLEESLAIVTQNHALADERIGHLTDEIQSMKAQNVSLRQSRDETQAILSETSLDLKEVSFELTNLLSKGHTVERYNKEIDELRAEVIVLRGERTVLIPQTERVEFRCTGSMEPTITCLDMATFMTNPLPLEVVIGSVISFAAPEDCTVQGEAISHRVTKRMMIAGEMNYRAKGDNNLEDDGCWIPHSNVKGVLMSLDKDVVPENAGRRDLINEADRDSRRVRRSWEFALSEYEDYCERHTVVTGECRVPNNRYERALELKKSVDVVRARLISVQDYHQCLVDGEASRVPIWTGNSWAFSPSPLCVRFPVVEYGSN